MYIIFPRGFSVFWAMINQW